MLFALRQPATLLGLVLGFAVGAAARVAVQRAWRPGFRASGGLSRALSPRSWLDPYAVVAAVLSGVGWTPRQETTRFGRGRATRVWLDTVLAVVVHGLLAAAGLAAFVAAGGPHSAFPFLTTTDILHGAQPLPTDIGIRVSLGFAFENLAMGVLALVPIPPLEAGVAAWSTLPRTPGARRLAYRLLEEQWGVAAILLLVLLPLAGQQPALLALIGAIGDGIVHAV